MYAIRSYYARVEGSSFMRSLTGSERGVQRGGKSWLPPPRRREGEGVSAQAGSAAGAGQHAGRGDLVPAGRAVEPVLAELALRLGEPLLLLALGAEPVHLALFHIVRKEQAAAGAFLGPRLADLRPAARLRAEEA